MPWWGRRRPSFEPMPVPDDPPEAIQGTGTEEQRLWAQLLKESLQSLDKRVPPWVLRLAAGCDVRPGPGVVDLTEITFADPKPRERRLHPEGDPGVARVLDVEREVEVAEARRRADEAARPPVRTFPGEELLLGALRRAHAAAQAQAADALGERRQELEHWESYGSDEPGPGFAHAAQLIAGVTVTTPEIALIVSRWLERPDARITAGLKNALLMQGLREDDATRVLLLLDQSQSSPRTRDWLVDALSRWIDPTRPPVVDFPQPPSRVDLTSAAAAATSEEQEESRSRRG